MLAKDFLEELDDMISKFGNLPIVGGYILDDTTPSKISAIDKEGSETIIRAKATGFFFE